MGQEGWLHAQGSGVEGRGWDRGIWVLGARATGPPPARRAPDAWS